MKQRVFSGIQPTGDLHIGNYLGAMKNWVNLIDKYDCIFSIVDLHALTIPYEPKDMQKRIFDAVSLNIAAGLDPKKCIIFVQSHVKEHTELTWLLNTVTPMGELSRMTQFKEKSQQHSANVNVGLFNYPVLMAADIVLYDAAIVPVGEDQIQHLEFTREVVRDFNNRYGVVLTEPQPLLTEAKRIMGLDGTKKMSKSMNNYISLMETEQSLWEKLRGAYTDPQRLKKSDPGNPDICNIYDWHKYFSTKEERDNINTECRKAGIGCVECKKIVMKNILNELNPIQEKKKELDTNPDMVYSVLEDGQKKCKQIASAKMECIKKSMGLIR